MGSFHNRSLLYYLKRSKIVFFLFGRYSRLTGAFRFGANAFFTSWGVKLAFNRSGKLLVGLFFSRPGQCRAHILYFGWYSKIFTWTGVYPALTFFNIPPRLWEKENILCLGSARAALSTINGALINILCRCCTPAAVFEATMVRLHLIDFDRFCLFFSLSSLVYLL